MKKSAELQENLIRRIGLITFVFLMVLLMIGLVVSTVLRKLVCRLWYE